jgi:hypothetical protein
LSGVFDVTPYGGGCGDTHISITKIQLTCHNRTASIAC